MTYILRMQLCAALLLIALTSTAQFTIKEDFKGSSSAGITLGGNAMLTSGTIDPVGEGWLRLTSATLNQSGYGIVNSTFPSTLGVLVDFEYTAWRNTADGADGFSVFLFDAMTTPFSIGGIGGSLGYAQYNQPPTSSGLSGGYIGIGVDEFGNFSSNVNGKSGGPGNTPNAIGVRGPAPNYTYITGHQIIATDAGTGDNGGVDYNTLTATRPTSSQFYRRIQFEITPAGSNFTLTVRWKESESGSFITLLGPVTLSTAPPPLLKVGFAASTGASINNHEIRNVLITTPGNTRVTKTGPAMATFGGMPLAIPYQVVVSNGTAGTVTGITLTDQFPPGYTATLGEISVDNHGNAVNQVHNLAVTAGVVTGTIDLAAHQEITLNINGHLNSFPPTGTISNFVNVGPGNITDIDPTNNVAQTNTMILNALLPVTLKSFTARKTGDEVLLKWATTNDHGFSHTEVERSADGTTFKKLAQLPAQPGTTPEKEYQYTDMNPLAGTAYYRLKLVDPDGQYRYSGIRRIDPGNANNDWAIYPNPASVRAVVDLPADWSQGATNWSIVDMTGRKLAGGISYSGTQLSVPVTTIPAGRYTLVMQHREKGLSHSLALQVMR